jgi:hypothetical protein
MWALWTLLSVKMKKAANSMPRKKLPAKISPQIKDTSTADLQGVGLRRDGYSSLQLEALLAL